MDCYKARKNQKRVLGYVVLDLHRKYKRIVIWMIPTPVLDFRIGSAESWQLFGLSLFRRRLALTKWPRVHAQSSQFWDRSGGPLNLQS